MDINSYAQEMDQALRDYITLLDHIDTGALINTLFFTISKTGDGYNMSLEANDYILWLDDNEFLDNFYELPSTIDILERLADDIAIEELSNRGIKF